MGLQGGTLVKNLLANAENSRDTGSIPGLGRPPGVGDGNPLQYSCMEKSHGQSNVVGYSPWGCKESEVTEHSTASWVDVFWFMKIMIYNNW